MNGPPRILLARAIEAGAQAALAAWAELVPPGDDLVASLAGCDGAVLVLSNRLGPADFARLAGSRLRIIANHAVGYENLDLTAAATAGIWITNTPDVLTAATAELAWSLLLALARRLIEGDRLMRSGGWQGWTPTQLLGRSVVGGTLGIVGAGRIGQAMAEMGRGFGVRLLYANRSPKPDFEARTGARRCSLAELFAEADLISLHLPGGAETRHLIGPELLARVRPGTLLVNTGRGNVLAEADLVQALETGPLGGAALDVYEFEPRISDALRALPNVVLAPHIGSATVETRRAMGLRCLENLQAGLAGLRPRDALNAPGSMRG